MDPRGQPDADAAQNAVGDVDEPRSALGEHGGEEQSGKEQYAGEHVYDAGSLAVYDNTAEEDARREGKEVDRGNKGYRRLLPSVVVHYGLLEHVPHVHDAYAEHRDDAGDHRCDLEFFVLHK